jgi:ABC-type glycerol-3-phosphate transport system substrate-binding protein
MEDIFMKKYRKYIIAVMTVLLIAVGRLTACGKSTAQDLQSHQWTFASSKKDNAMAATAKFNQKATDHLTQAGLSECLCLQVD